MKISFAIYADTTSLLDKYSHMITNHTNIRHVLIHYSHTVHLTTKKQQDLYRDKYSTKFCKDLRKYKKRKYYR